MASEFQVWAWGIYGTDEPHFCLGRSFYECENWTSPSHTTTEIMSSAARQRMESTSEICCPRLRGHVMVINPCFTRAESSMLNSQ